MGVAFRYSAGFGKRMEYSLVRKMLMEGLDVYLPLVDDHGVDAVIKKEDGTFIEVQIKQDPVKLKKEMLPCLLLFLMI